MTSMARFGALFAMGVLSAGCSLARPSEPRLKNVSMCAMPAATADIKIDSLPAWALERQSFAAWVGDDIVLAGGTPPNIHVAVIEGATGRLRDIAIGNVDLPRWGSDWRVYFTVAGTRLISLWHSYAVDEVHGVVVDVPTGVVTRLSTNRAPSRNIMATSPYLVATTPNAFVMWPRVIGNGQSLDSVVVLDTRSGEWSSISTNLGMRLSPQVAALADGRVVVWGGVANRESTRILGSGVVINPEQRSVRPFEYPRAPIGLLHAAPTGTLLSSVAVGEPNMEGFVIDIDSGKMVTMPSVSVEKSFRNHSVSHFDGKFFLYVAKDELWVFDVARKQWQNHAMPFEPNMPSDISVYGLDVGRVLFTGTSTGDYVFHAADGRFCSVPRSDNLIAPVHVLVSPKRRAILGSVTMSGGGAPGCPPGAPCAIEEEKRTEDRRGVISVLP